MLPNKRNSMLTPLTLNASHPLGMGSALRMDTDVMRNSILHQMVQHFPGGSMNFEQFETDNIDECVCFVKDSVEWPAEVNGVSVEEMKKGMKIVLTGCGAHELFGEALGGVDMCKEDEMECLIKELKFIMLILDKACIDAVCRTPALGGRQQISQRSHC
jgi:type II pantothenate kinase